MCYPDRNSYITFLFQLLEEFEASVHSNRTARRGCPKVHSDSSLIVFFAVMELKEVSRFKAQHTWLRANPHWLQTLKLDTVPSRVTLFRRYKQMAPKLKAFVTYLGHLGATLDLETTSEVVYEDKSLYKAKGSVWHQKDRRASYIPKGLHALDTDARGSKRKYCGWVYGYGLHLTVSEGGFPLLAFVDTASVSEKAVLDLKTESMVDRNIGYIVADGGYTDLKRVKALAKKGVLLLTLVAGAKSRQAVCYLEAVNNSEQLGAYQKKRKTVIEPVFALLSALVSTPANQKQLSVSRIENVNPFLMLAVMLLQLAMLVNLTWNLPFGKVS